LISYLKPYKDPIDDQFAALIQGMQLLTLIAALMLKFDQSKHSEIHVKHMTPFFMPVSLKHTTPFFMPV
jgi:hypothetical protein